MRRYALSRLSAPFVQDTQLSWRRAFCLLVCLLAVPAAAGAQSTQAASTSGSAGQGPLPPVFTSRITVVATTPLQDTDLPLTMVPVPVLTATDVDVEQSGAVDIASFLNRRATSVHVNEIQGNPFQMDVNYRGYTASPLLGTPQGLSVYMDGVRLNQPFGDVVSWDLIPHVAIGSIAMMPGSNPLFGLNTLGGALTIRTKDGTSHPGTSARATYGSNARRTVELEHGGRDAASGFDWYAAGNFFAEDGWRDASPSDVRQLFGKVRWTGAASDVGLTAAYADNSLTGNGVQDERLLERDYSSIYTKPDTTDDTSLLLDLAGHHSRDRLMLSGNIYYRHLRTKTLNGDINEESLDQSLYQPNEEEQEALAAAGYTGVPESGASAENTPFPYWRCIGNVLLQDEPAEKCNGLLNRTASRQKNAGVAGQLTLLPGTGRAANRLTVGAAFDWNATDFAQSAELGYLNPDRGVTPTGAFGDGVTGGTVDGEPYDVRVDLAGHSTTASVYATDTLTFDDQWHVTFAGRFNQTTVHNDDRINPAPAPGSLDGDHTFRRFNPSIGVTRDLPRGMNAYASYSEASRAPTSIELGCADPNQPCKLPNAMAGDPPLDQVVARTWEGGVRGSGRAAWSAGVFRANTDDDIIFVTSGQTGFGYFTNFGKTRRQGVEVSADGRIGPARLGLGYTFLDATYRSAGTVNGESNSTNDAALEGEKGMEGTIDVKPGDRVPLIPRHLLKTFAEVAFGRGLSVGVDLIAASGSFARGNENNAHAPDGTYYLGPGSTDAYAVVNVGARQRLSRHVELVVQIDNLFDQRYATAALLGPAGFTPSGTFVARPLPPVDGEYPLQSTTFLAPGAPRTIWGGARLTL